ncbi:MAG TPA: histidine kinase [Gemmatimonadales bacterium]|nr:histidine kinase [Gemmatimonadales bacterium]
MPDPAADSPPPGTFPKPGDSGLTRLAYLRQVLGASPPVSPAPPAAAPPLHPAEKALQESQRLLELFFSQSLDGFFFMMLDDPVRWDESVDKEEVLDWVFEHQRITRVNDAMAAQYGARPEQLVGLTPAALYAHDPVYGRRVWREFLDAGRLHAETEERRLDGRPVWIEGDYICLYAPDGRLMGHFGIQRDITARRTAEDGVRRSREELRALAARLQSVREDERTRISREVHDELGQALTGLRLDLSWLKSRLRDRPDLAERVQSVVTRIDGTIDAVRRIATELRPSVLDHLGLVAAVEWQAQEFEKRTGTVVRLQVTSAHPAVDDARATTVFRILQESLTNVARHAGASRVDITLALGPAEVSLRVVDDGRGISEAERTGLRSLGLVGIRERAIACSGECTIEGFPGQGTTVTARIPLGPAEAR